MNRRSVITGGLLAAGYTLLGRPDEALAQAKPMHHGAPMASNWVTLFDGTNLSGWHPIGNANWRLEGGAVVADKGEGFLITEHTYADFQLKVEFWVNDTANSGVFIRCAEPDKVTGANAYEVNIFDQRPDPTYGTGAIVNVAKVVPMPKAGGRWNFYDITAHGPRFTIVLNGKRTVNGAVDYKHASGWIALQYGKAVVDTGVVKFRKVQIRTL
jgi:hypothetical protein